MTTRKRTNPKRNLALRLYFTPGNETFGNIRKTAEKINCNPDVLGRWIKSDAGKEFQREIEAEQRIASYITIEKLQHKLYQIVEKAIEAKQYHAAISALNSLLKTLGGFIGERLPPENLAGKIADLKNSENVLKAIQMYYEERYGVRIDKSKETPFFGQTPVTPQHPPPD